MPLLDRVQEVVLHDRSISSDPTHHGRTYLAWAELLGSMPNLRRV
jgi:hypothetical protein